MRAIIIDDKDARVLLNNLKLESMQKGLPGYGVESHEAWSSLPDHIRNEVVSRMHGKFHFIVCQWLQDQGANTVR